jgi:Rrf2 family iron-sulfur cluster assembly transcriptional regulator
LPFLDKERAAVRMNAKCCYSVLAAVELAKDHPAGKALCVRELAGRTGVPEGFLVQILQTLRRAGIVESVRGAGGGFRLAAAPQDISVGKVLRASGECDGYVETSSFADGALEHTASRETARALGLVLSEAERALARTFDGQSLAAVLARVAGRAPAPEYQI